MSIVDQSIDSFANAAKQYAEPVPIWEQVLTSVPAKCIFFGVIVLAVVAFYVLRSRNRHV